MIYLNNRLNYVIQWKLNMIKFVYFYIIFAIFLIILTYLIECNLCINVISNKCISLALYQHNSWTLLLNLHNSPLFPFLCDFSNINSQMSIIIANKNNHLVDTIKAVGSISINIHLFHVQILIYIISIHVVQSNLISKAVRNCVII